MIRISIGNVGSGKTLNEVREILLDRARRKTFTNIQTKIDHAVEINPGMIIKKSIVDHKLNRKTGEETPVYEYEVNKEFWQKIKEPINVVIDEAHTVINSRRAMSRVNIIMTDWLALIRRVLGQGNSGYGELVFITQLPQRIDPIAREMATQIRYHKGHYVKICNTCTQAWSETSEMPERYWVCPRCHSKDIKITNYKIEIWHFASMDNYQEWKMFGVKSFYKHYLVSDVERFFPLYQTLQWDNLFSEYR